MQKTIPLSTPGILANRRGTLQRHLVWPRHPATLAAGILLWLMATAWLRPLALPDEGRYVGVAWEMLRSGDWLTPTVDGLPFFHKPPLFYWVTAGAMALFGPSQLAGRAAPLLGGTLAAMALHVFAKAWWGPRAARLALLALLVQPLLYAGSQYANLDMLVAGCITATVTLLAHAALCAERALPFRRTLLAGFAMAAIGVLAKGLIGIVLPVLVVGGWLVVRRQWRVLRQMLWWPAALLLLAMAAPWFVLMQLRFDGFLHYVFVVQHFQRFAGAGFNNVQPGWFYPVVLLLASLPCVVWLRPPALRGYLADPQRGPVRLLLWLWVAAVLVFFSLPQSKLVGYILPTVPPLALLMADGADGADGRLSARTGWRGVRRVRWWTASLVASALLSIGIVAASLVHPGMRSTRALAQALATQRQPHEPVLMFNHYIYDVPFYAGLAEPVAVVGDWTDPQLALHDDWRRELADAGRFATPAQAARLIDPAALAPALCSTRISWLIGPTADRAQHPFLQHAHAVTSQQGMTLWRIDSAVAAMAQALGCHAGFAAQPNSRPDTRRHPQAKRQPDNPGG